jgi:hypothetical protein
MQTMHTVGSCLLGNLDERRKEEASVSACPSKPVISPSPAGQSAGLAAHRPLRLRGGLSLLRIYFLGKRSGP